VPACKPAQVCSLLYARTSSVPGAIMGVLTDRIGGGATKEVCPLQGRLTCVPDVIREGPQLGCRTGWPQASALACLSPCALMCKRAEARLGKARLTWGVVGPVERRAHACPICT